MRDDVGKGVCGRLQSAPPASSSACVIVSSSTRAFSQHRVAPSIEHLLKCALKAPVERECNPTPYSIFSKLRTSTHCLRRYGFLRRSMNERAVSSSVPAPSCTVKDSVATAIDGWARVFFPGQVPSNLFFSSTCPVQDRPDAPPVIPTTLHDASDDSYRRWSS